MRQDKKSQGYVLLIVPDSELQVPRHNTLLLVVTGGVASELENLSCEVLKDCSKIDCAVKGMDQFRIQVRLERLRLTWCASTNTLSVVAPLEQTVDTTDRELETSLCRARLRLGVARSLATGLSLAAALARHFALR